MRILLHVRDRIYSLAVAAFLLTALHITGEPSYLAPDEEAPVALIDTQLGDAGVSLFLDGFWEMYLTGSIGLSFVPGVNEPLFRPFPGMTPGVAFRQVPDLTLFLLIDDRYSFEATFIDGYELNRFILGYDGKPNEPLQSIRIGNDDIDFGSYPLLPFGEIPKNAIGASVAFGLGLSRHELAMRLQPAGLVNTTYIGSDEVTRLDLQPSEYLKGRYFELPDRGISDLQVYVEQPGSADAITTTDGKKFGLIDANLISVSEVNGTIRFKQIPDGQVLVYYTKSGIPVGDPALGIGALAGLDGSEEFFDATSAPRDFYYSSETYFSEKLDTYSVSDGLRDLLVLYSPGEFSPFEHAGYYSLPQGLSDKLTRILSTIEIRDADGERSTVPLEVEVTDDYSHIRVWHNETAATPQRRYPLSPELPELYGPNRLTDSAGLSERILIDLLVRFDDIILDQPIPGSVRVHVNGEPEFRFAVDESGLLDLGFSPLPTDIIDVSYTSRSFTGLGTDVAIAYGSNIFIDESTEAMFSAGTFWNAATNTYSDHDIIHPGNLVATATFSHISENFSAIGTAGITVSSPDTTGVFRILGSIETSTNLSLGGDVIFPSPPPIHPADMLIFTTENRGRLIYKDYTSYDIGGVGVLNRFDWPDLDADQVSAYESGGVSGPYLATAGVDDRVIPVAVLDFEFDSDHKWIGAIARGPDTTGATDASGFTTIEFAWLSPDSYTGTIHVQIGAIAEDLDDDGLLDAESSAEGLGFLFDDVSANSVLRVGTSLETGNDKLDTEDANANGRLDSELVSAIITRTFTFGDVDYPVPDEWRSVEIHLTEEERKALTLVRSVRIIIENNDSVDVAGRLLVGDISFTGHTVSPVRSDIPYVSVDGVSTGDVIDELESRFPDVASRFHKDGFREIIRIDYANEASIRPLTIRSRLNGARAADYDRISYYLRGSESTVNLKLEDSFGNGLTFSIDVPDDELWHKATYNYRNDEIDVDGVRVENQNGYFDEDSSYLRHLTITVTASDEGTLYIDEIHLADSRLVLGTGGDVTTTLASPGVVWQAGNIPLISDIAISQTFSWATAGFSPSTTLVAGNYARFRTALSASLTYVRTEIFLDASLRDSGAWISGGHTITIPSVSFPVQITDGFSSARGELEQSYTRNNELNVIVPTIGSFLANATIESRSNSLDQHWEMAGVLSPWRWLRSDLTVTADQFIPATVTAPVNHFAQLVESYTYLVPQNIAESERKMRIASNLNLVNNLFGILLSPGIYVQNTGNTPEYVRVAGEIGLSIPFSPITPAMPAVTLSFDRTFTHRYPTAVLQPDLLTISPQIFGDMASVIYEIRDDSYFIQLPFVDFFLNDLGDRFTSQTTDAEESAYSSAVGVDISRNNSASLGFSIFPASFAVSFQRDIVATYVGFDDNLTGKTDIVWTSINLFGKYGLRPTFNVFESDEYSLRLSGTLARLYSPDPVETIVAIESSAAFFSDYNKLTASNVASLDFTDGVGFDDTLEMELSHRYIVEKGINIPFLNYKVENDVYFMHSESIEGSWSGATQGISMLISHKSTLHIADYGVLSASAGMGLLTATTDEAAGLRVWDLGFEGSIEVRISL